MQSNYKRVVGGVLVVFAFYLVLPPMICPPPHATASIPETMSLREDPEFTAVVRAWHSNVNIVSVRFYVDYYASTAKGPKGLFNPTILYQGAPRDFSGLFDSSPLTYPWSKRLDLKLPLRDFAAQGLVGPGVLEGKLDISLSYLYRGERHAPGLKPPLTQRTQSVPFRIEIRE
ncbi:MAG: hypothetical protein HZB26_07445 [Candidatus Hydrogenedentes bacterium]|nr:hypothetical protein [Candidatus Hydrogenedentota bacterium]